MPKVSVVIPTYNRSSLLKQAMESVCAQTFQDWELIVIDNGSTDDTAQTIKEYSQKDPRISYEFRNRIRLSRVRTLGTELAKGEYLTFLDDDDCFFPNKLKDQVNFLDKNQNIALVYSHLKMVDQNGKLLGLIPEKPATNYLELIASMTIQLNSALIRKSCLGSNVNFNAAFTSCDDYEFCLRLTRKFPIAFLPGEVGIYRWHDGNMSHKKALRIKSEIKIYKWVLKNAESEQEKKAVLRRVLELTYWKASDAFAAGNYSDACLYFWMALRFNPFIGLSIPWGQFSNVFYRILKPYGAVAYSGLKSLTNGKSNG